MSALDWILVGIAVLAAVSGWRQGLVAGVLSFAGFIGGALVGVLLAPYAVRSFTGLTAAAIGVGVVIVAAGIGNMLASWLGARLRSWATWSPVRLLDSVGGAMFGVLSLALVAWLVASAILSAPLGPVTAAVRGSTVLGGIDAAVPPSARDWVAGLRTALDSSGFPAVFAGFALDPLIPVEPPDPATLADPAVRTAIGSLVKVEGLATGCDSQVDGSGFVISPEHVMTNAHVVAGVTSPTVLVRGVGTVLAAQVVYFDPRVDVAILDVPGLAAPALSFEDSVRRGDSAVVAGFPGGGRLASTPARVRGRISARGTDIYGRGDVVRDVYSLRATIRPGNSGGPLLSPSGRVEGVVFAASVTDKQTGYALTARQVSTAVAAGRSATAPVGTGSCETR